MNIRKESGCSNEGQSAKVVHCISAIGLIGIILGGSSGAAVPSEPTDNEILRAVVQSMQRYYARRAARIPRVTTMHRLHKRDEEVVCYDHLGCFRDEGPFDYLDVLPLSPEQIRTRFLLYTRRNPAHPIYLHYANTSTLYTSYFNRSNLSKIMIHGFGSSCQKQWATEMRKALLQVENANVVCVDWEEGAALPHYVQAAANTRLVGKQVARLIASLNHLRGTNNSQFHIIGFSLGAHVAGFAGDEMDNISRITGLDPAAPLFEGYSTKARLDPSDANFVDVIHSNGDSLLYGGLGAFDAMGHADYYPNGGKVQAGCSNIFVGAISDLIWYQPRSVDGRSLCNHRRAYKFFTDSVLKNCAFPAFACNDYDEFLRGECFPCGPSGTDCGNMGYFADRSEGRGKFYLLTRNSEPFCANQFKVTIESSSNLAPTYGALELTLINRNHLNETFQVTSEWEQLVPGKPLTRVIVAHPTMTDLVSAQIKYTPYKGWITSGLERWAVDRLVVINSFGRRYSLCRKGVPLAEHKPTTVYLSKEDCTDHTTMHPNKNESQPTVLFDVSKPGFTKKPIVEGGSIDNAVQMDLSQPAMNFKGGNAFKLSNQILYFQFFPMPIHSGNVTTSLPFARKEVNGDSIVYNIAPADGGVELGGSTKRIQRLGQPKISNKFGFVRLRPTGSIGNVKNSHRLARKLAFNRDGRSHGIVPDIGAQIVFVPNGHPPQQTYIPLRPPSQTKSARRLRTKSRSTTTTTKLSSRSTPSSIGLHNALQHARPR